MDDDLEYFISFPTPKPYIENLNKKFTSKENFKDHSSDSSNIELNSSSLKGKLQANQSFLPLTLDNISISTDDRKAILKETDSVESDCESDFDDHLINCANNLPYFG